MADKTTGGLPAAQEATIGSLPDIADLYDDTLLPVEQQGEARHMTGLQWKRYAEAAVAEDVRLTSDAADRAARSAQEASGYAKDAGTHAQAAETAKNAAETARESAIEARKAIEDMTVSAVTLPSGSAATAEKTAAAGSFHIRIGVPQGKQGDTGPQGPQGIQGPEGPRGLTGTVVETSGTWAFSINEAGHLLVSYAGADAPDFSIGANGHLYLNLT